MDPSDSYYSAWVGGRGGGPPLRLACGGQPVTGIYGRSSGVLHALGLIQADWGERRDPDRLRIAIRTQIQLATEALAAQPNDAAILFERADFYTWLGQYVDAAADYDRALALRPDHYLPATVNALIHLISGDRQTYLHLSEQTLRSFHDRSDWEIITVCRTYLLAPRPDSAVGSMVGRIYSYHTEELRSPLPLTYGLLKYRRNEFQEAEHWLRMASEMSPGGPEKATADLFRAMTLERLGHHDEALRLFQQARDILQPSEPDALIRHYPRDLPEWMTALAAFKEAESTIRHSKPLDGLKGEERSFSLRHP